MATRFPSTTRCLTTKLQARLIWLNLKPLLLRLLQSGWLFVLCSCGPGFHLGAPGADSFSTSRFALRLSDTNLRKNECVAVTVAVEDASSSAGSPVNVNLVASSGLKIYRSAAGCQTYTSSDETSAVFLNSYLEGAVVYIRADSTGNHSLRASANGSEVEYSTVSLASEFVPFDSTNGLSGAVNAIAFDSQGRLYAGGEFRSFGDYNVAGLARFLPDGSFDSTFLPQGTGLNGIVYTIQVQSDDRILVGGNFTSYNGQPAPYVARIDTNGLLDSTFAQTGTGLNQSVSGLAIQTDGKILVGGAFTQYNGLSRSKLVRLESDGSLDSSFTQTGTGFNDNVFTVTVQADGRILVGGNFTAYHLSTRSRIARLNSDGTLDGTFSQTGSGLSSHVGSIAIQGDSKIIVGGDFTTYNGSNYRYIARLNSNGTIDATFNTGTGFNGDVAELVLQADGKVVVAGVFSTFQGNSYPYLVRLNSDGSRDSSFAPGGGVPNNYCYSVAMRSDQKVAVGGTFTLMGSSVAYYLALLDSSGGMEWEGGNSSSSPDNYVNRVVPLEDGSLIAAGGFNAIGAEQRASIAKYKSDGSLEPSFTQTGTGLNGAITDLAVQSDGKIVVAGYFTSYNSISRPYIARLNADGSLDTSFATTGSGLNFYVYAVGLQADGKIVVGGVFNTYNGTSRPCLARLNSDGSLDSTFSVGTGLNFAPFDLAVQSDGKILVGGFFTDYNGTSVSYVVRINTDGSIDNSFARVGTGLSSSLQALAVQDDGRVIVAGAFTNYNSTPIRGVARLNADGSLDTGFSLTGTGLNSAANAVAILPTGKVLVSGYFSNYNGTSVGGLIRLNPDGTLDGDFALSLTLGGTPLISSIALTPSNKIVIGGQFMSISNQAANYLARLTYLGSID